MKVGIVERRVVIITSPDLKGIALNGRPLECMCVCDAETRNAVDRVGACVCVCVCVCVCAYVCLCLSETEMMVVMITMLTIMTLDDDDDDSTNLKGSELRRTELGRFSRFLRAVD
jgi:hypothetical protein